MRGYNSSMFDLVLPVLMFVLGSIFGRLGDDIYLALSKKWKQFRSPFIEVKHPIKGYYYNEPKPRRIWHKGYFKN